MYFTRDCERILAIEEVHSGIFVDLVGRAELDAAANSAIVNH